jgi:hypothetical protein
MPIFRLPSMKAPQFDAHRCRAGAPGLKLHARTKLMVVCVNVGLAPYNKG